jgi:hypothetical protein
MNELQEQFGDKGLTIIGVTDEGKKETEGFVTATSMKYAYAYDKGGKLASFFGVSGIPHAAIIDPTGKIVWEGNPGGLGKEVIEKYLTGALPKPMWEWPASAAAARTALQKGKYADALAAAAKIPEADGGAAIQSALTAMIQGRVSGMKASFTEGDFLSAKNAAIELQKTFDGLPEKAEADKMLADIKANADAEKIMKAQKSIRDLLGQRLGKSREYEKALTDLQKIQKELEGTFAAKEAGEALNTIRKRKQAQK